MYSTDACCNYQGGYLSRRSSSRRTELGIHRIAQESTASELPAVVEQHPARARGEIYPEAAAELQSSTWYVILNSSHWSEVIYIYCSQASSFCIRVTDGGGRCQLVVCDVISSERPVHHLHRDRIHVSPAGEDQRRRAPCRLPASHPDGRHEGTFQRHGRHQSLQLHRPCSIQ